MNAERTLGRSRWVACLNLVLAAERRRRQYELAYVAALVVGTKALGPSWWTDPRPPYGCDTWADARPPDEALFAITPTSSQRSTLEVLSGWISDDAAHRTWGPASVLVDLNRPSARAPLPPGAKDGDRFLADWDLGCRVEARVVTRQDGTLGTEMSAELLFAPPAEAWWAWARLAHGMPTSDEEIERELQRLRASAEAPSG